ncbi:hypothetical protein IX51_03385 [uncultured archaeon]|nr:hypothetical protein IX51_03385 [uncultured archaeon]
MVQFDGDFKQRMKERMEKFSKFDKKGDVFSNVSVTVSKGNNLFSRASPGNQEFSWVSDENGPSPLAYFVSSLAMCQMIHYGEHAGSKDLVIDHLTIGVEGKFSVSRPRSFSEIVYFVDIRSPENVEKIRELASVSASDCYVTNTLSKACEVKGLLTVNGNEMERISLD